MTGGGFFKRYFETNGNVLNEITISYRGEKDETGSKIKLSYNVDFLRS